jgi:hypothetical protein
MADGPQWLRAVLFMERSVSGSINRATNSGQAADVLMLMSRGNRVARRARARLTGALLHGLYLPTRRDVQLLDAKVEHVQRMLDELAARTAEQRSGR